MRNIAKTTRRTLGAVFAASAVGGVAALAITVPAAPSATAAADPCAASEVARTIGSVATSMSSYLDSHPDTNTALTTISQQQAGPQSLVALKSYFDANPQAAKDMQTLQSPLVTLSSKCKLPLTLPQVMGLLQGAQSAGGLPGAQSTSQSVGVPGTSSPALTTPAGPGAAATGPLPGPGSTSTLLPR